MPDIIVTTPKRRMAEAAREAEDCKAWGGGYYYRGYPIKRAPKIQEGERVYYVENGYVRGFAVVSRIRKANTMAEPEIVIQMDATSWTWIKPVPATHSPRSWQYVATFGLSRKNVEVVGGWLDPKPEVSA